MKSKLKQIIPLIIILAFTTLTSCRRASDNGLIDGLWRIDQIDYFEQGQQPSTIHPQGFFIAIQLELLQLDNYNPVATAIISYDKDKKTLGLDFPYNPDAALLRKFGIMQNPCVINVEHLNHKRMVLTTGSSRITCIRF